MKEEYLHLIWNQKRIPFHQMKLTNGQNFTVKKNGQHNKESGPDFFDGEVIIDNITWRGNIEIHVKSSDWNLHNHTNDQAYYNVILHVVYEHDKEIVIGDRLLPTLELKSVIDEKHFQNYCKIKYSRTDFVCENLIHEFDPIYLEAMKEKAIVRRLNRKILDFKGLENDENDYGQILYELLAKSFGMKVNSQPFQELSQRIPLKIIKRERKEYIPSLIIGTSGLLEEVSNSHLLHDWLFLKEKYCLHTMQKFVWKKKGLRSSGFPFIRLTQFSEVIQKFDFDTYYTYLNATELVEYLYALLDISSQDNARLLKLSRTTKETIIVNSFVPFLWWFGQIRNDEKLMDKVIDVLLLLGAEDNQVLSKWRKIGIEAKNSYDSQALLEIYNEFCFRKKCLFCTLGDKIMNG